MTVIKDYHGPGSGHVHLDFYTTAEDGRRGDRGSLVDQDAYDAWHLHYYIKEVLRYREFISGRATMASDFPRKERNFLLYPLLDVMPRPITLTELGISLLELADGLRAVDAIVRRRNPILEGVCIQGIEISEFFRNVARMLHPNDDVRLFPDCTSIDRPGVLFDRAVSSYAFTDAREWASVLNRSDAALLNLLLSKNDTFLAENVGKSLTYFSLADMLKHLNKPLFHLFGFHSPNHDWVDERNAIEGFFLLADKNVAERFMDQANRYSEIASFFRLKEIRLTPASQLL